MPATFGQRAGSLPSQSAVETSTIPSERGAETARSQQSASNVAGTNYCGPTNATLACER